MTNEKAKVKSLLQDEGKPVFKSIIFPTISETHSGIVRNSLKVISTFMKGSALPG